MMSLKVLDVFSGKDTYRKYPNGDELYAVSILCEIREFSGDLKINDGESTELKWFKVNELPENLSPVTEKFIDKIKKYLIWEIERKWKYENINSLLFLYRTNEVIAEKIKKELDCDILELQPVIPFSSNYQEVVDEYQNNESEMKTVDIENINVNLEEYDKIVIGTPVWWYTITPVIRTFLKKYDLSGKMVYAFVTNAGWLGRTFKEIKNICNGEIKGELNVVFKEDYREHNCLTSDEEINSFIELIKWVKFKKSSYIKKYFVINLNMLDPAIIA